MDDQRDELTRRKVLKATGAAAVAGGAFATGSTAQSQGGGNPHFIYCRLQGNQVCFKIAGLGSTVTTTINLTSSGGTVTEQCVTNSGNCPSAANKTNTGPTSVSGEFTSGKNGQITGCLPLPSASTSLSCPPGQTKELVSATFNNVQVTQSDAGSCSVGNVSIGPFDVCREKGGGKK